MGKDTIIIVRHGKSALSRDTALDWRAYRKWWQTYDETGLEPGQTVPPAVKAWAEKADIVISSPLRRAVETARQARGGQDPDKIDPDLVEAHLPPPHWGKLRFKPRTWGVWSRVAWYVGFPDDMETRQEAEVRAARMAEKLEAEAAGGKIVFVTAHGWYNRMLKGALQKRGWKCREQNGDRHWSRRRFERETRTDK